MISARAFAVTLAALLPLSTASLATLTAGCGDGKGANSAHITAGPMPEGEIWRGVYYHPVYGYLHLIEQENNVVGRWKRTDQSAWGELSGTKSGNVLHFTWKEHKNGMVGPSSSSHGKGVFVYKTGQNKGIAELDGQFGLDNDETGQDWHNVKQQRVEPDLKSIGGDHTGGSSAGGFE